MTLYAGLVVLVAAVNIQFASANSHHIADQFYLNQLKASSGKFNHLYNVTVNSGQGFSIQYDHDYKGVRKLWYEVVAGLEVVGETNLSSTNIFETKQLVPFFLHKREHKVEKIS